MKKSMFPSAEIVGRNSGRLELIFIPIFSILRMVPAVITLSFCGTKVPDVSVLADGWAGK